MFLAHLLKSRALHLHLINLTSWKTKWRNFTPRILWMNYWKIQKKSLATWNPRGNVSRQNSKTWHYDHIEIVCMCFKIDLRSSFLVSLGTRIVFQELLCHSLFDFLLAWLGRVNFKQTTRYKPCPCTRSVFSCSLGIPPAIPTSLLFGAGE